MPKACRPQLEEILNSVMTSHLGYGPPPSPPWPEGGQHFSERFTCAGKLYGVEGVFYVSEDQTEFHLARFKVHYY